MSATYRITENRGSISIICLLLSMLALIIMLSVTTQSMNKMRMSNSMAQGAISLSIAEAGIEYTMAQFMNNNNYSGTGGAVQFAEGSFNTTVSQLQNGDYKIVSIGETTGDINRTVEVIISRSGSSSFPNGAIVANGGVQLSGNSTLKTNPINEGIANVHSNVNIQLNGNVNVDGALNAVGSVMQSGNINYKALNEGVSSVQFPSESEIDAMDEDLKAQAMQGTITGGISLAGNQNVTYTSPIFINGNLDLKGNSRVTFTGGGVVYVNGNISMSGNQRITNDGILVAKGTIQQTGNSIYTVDGDIEYAAIVSLSDNPTQAIQCTGNGDSVPMGIVYAPRGGIRFTGNSAVFGALVAGSSANQAVQCVGNANITYPLPLADHHILPRHYSVSYWLER